MAGRDTGGMRDLATLLSSLRATRDDPSEPVWDIRTPGFLRTIFRPQQTASFYAARGELLRTAVGLHGARHLVIDAPEMADVPGILSEEGQFRLQPEVDTEALDKTALHYGGWYLYAAPELESTAGVLQAFHASDVFRISPANLIELLGQLGLTFLIASFFDDNEWRVAAPSQGRTQT